MIEIIEIRKTKKNQREKKNIEFLIKNSLTIPIVFL